MRALLHIVVWLAVSFAAGCAPEPNYVGDTCGIEQSLAEMRANSKLVDCAARGDARAETQLGVLYWSAASSEHCSGDECIQGHAESFGLPERLTRAELEMEGLRLLELASRHGSASAQNELGLALLDGSFGLQRDESQAVGWFRTATAGGDSIAPYNLARLHITGRGVPLSLVEAEGYLRRSAERGYKPAQCSLARWLEWRDPRGHQAEIEMLRQAAAHEGQYRGARFGCTGGDVMREMPIQ